MLEDRFTLLLKDLSDQIGIELKPDSNNSCLLNLRDKLEVQLEMERGNENKLILGAVLGEMQPGKFREDMLFLALKSNAKPYPRVGNFAYTTKLNSLILFEILDIDHFSTGDIMSILIPFIHKALAWKGALSQGQVGAHLLEMDFIGMNKENLF